MMRKVNKEICIVLASALLVVAVFGLNVAAAKDVTMNDDTLTFVRNVVDLDMAKYVLEGSSRNSQVDENYPSMTKEYVSYTLQSQGGKTTVTFTYVNETMVRWSMNSFGNSPAYLQLASNNSVDSAKSFLQRYKTCSKTLILDDAIALLDKVNVVETQNITEGNMNLRITTQDNSTHFTWTKTVNGFQFPTGLSIRVKNGILDTFTDETAYRRIGSAEAIISKEQAVKIAWEHAKTYTSLNISLGDTNKVVPFSLKPEPTTVQLQINNREPYTSYPFWYIKFSAQEIQYGINGVEAGVWADTGELAYAQTTGYQGQVQDSEASKDTESLSSSTNSNAALPNVNVGTGILSTEVFVLATLFAAIIVVATAVVLRRRK
jgi:hypothetical protein